MMGGLGPIELLFGSVVWLLPLAIALYLVILFGRLVKALERIATAVERRP